MFDWTLAVVEQGGYMGIFALMVLENIFPPIPSEVILPLAGFIAAREELSFAGVVLVASLGALVGAMPWYALGYWLSAERLARLGSRHGRWFAFSSQDIVRAREWFLRHGRAAVLLARLVPTLRTLISIPAGIARMPLGAFLWYSFIGSALWSALLVSLGYILESQYVRVSGYVNLISNLVFVVMIAAYLYRVISFRPDRERGGQVH